MLNCSVRSRPAQKSLVSISPRLIVCPGLILLNAVREEEIFATVRMTTDSEVRYRQGVSRSLSLAQR